MISLSDTSSVNHKRRSEYIDYKLDDLKNQMSETKSNKKLKINKPKFITMENLSNISLNVLNNLHDYTSEPDHNRLRCTWLSMGAFYQTLIDTGASHQFLHENVLDKIPPHLIINKIKYQSGMLTAAGNLKNNIKYKAIIITTFICKNEKSLSLPIEYLVASSLNNWDIILGESFLGNNSLHLSITSSYLNLTWDLLKYSVLLHYSKPKDTIGYILCSKSYTLQPNETSWIHVKFILSKQSNAGMIDNDLIIKKGFSLIPTIIDFTKTPSPIQICNKSNKQIKISELMNIGLVYNTGFNNTKTVPLKNLINDPELNLKPNTIKTNINNYNAHLYINWNDHDDNSNQTEDYLDNYEDNVQYLVNDSTDSHYSQDASNEFMDHLTILPDPTENLETWSFKDVDISHLNISDKSKILEMLHVYSDTFAKNKLDVGCSDYLTAKIKVDKKHPSFVSQKQRFMEPRKLKVATEAANILLAQGIIRISKNPILKSNLCLVPRIQAGQIRDSTIAAKINNRRKDVKVEETWRVCVDLRNLNMSTLDKCAPALLTLDHILAKLNEKMVSNMDISNGFFNIKLCERSIPLMAFYLGDNIYEFTRLSQGFVNSPKIFVDFMKLIFSQSQFDTSWALLSENEQKILSYAKSYDDILISYMDDLWCFSQPEQGLEAHIPVIKMTLMALTRAKIKLGPKKCTFFTQDFKILGVNINSKNSELYINQKKALGIILWPRPNSLSELQSRIFSLNYWEKFIPKLREVISPWYLLIRSKKFEWDKECEESFWQLKSIILSDIKLAIPNEHSQLVMSTDASKISTSQILFIREETGLLKIAGCNSRIFSTNDSRRSPHYKEAISLATGFKVFSSYLSISNKPPIILCDARNLCYIARMKERSILANNLNWFLHDMSMIYNFQIFMIPGNINFMADIFSRSFSSSKYVCKDQYNLSKEHAEQLPEINFPFEINSKILQTYLKSDMLPSKDDFGNKSKNLPKYLEPILTMYLGRTGEERFVDAIVLLKQISSRINKSNFKQLIKTESLPSDFNLTEDEIKTLINHDTSSDSDLKNIKYLKPIIERIVENFFGLDIDSKHKNAVRNALLLNYVKIRNIDTVKSSDKSYPILNNLLIKEINLSIKSDFSNTGTDYNINLIKSTSTNLENSLSLLNTFIYDDHESISCNVLMSRQDIWENDNLITIMHNPELTDCGTDLENTVANLDFYQLNNQLLHSNVVKKDILTINPNNTIEVEHISTRINIYFSCDGDYPPSSSPYNLDAGIDLRIQENITLEPNLDVKINTKTKILLNSTTMGIILPKSRIMGKLQIFPGVIDPNYQGHIIIGVKNITMNPITFEKGTSFAQMCIMEINPPKLIRCDQIIYKENGPTRGAQGFGSSGNYISINLLEQNNSFLNTIGFNTPRPTKMFNNSMVSDLFSDTMDFNNDIDIPLIEKTSLDSTKSDQLNSWKYLRTGIMKSSPEERQSLIKTILGLQLIKQAVIYTDLMDNNNFNSDCLSRLQQNDEYFGLIYKKVLNNSDNMTRYKLINSILYKEFGERWALCIPNLLLIGLIRIIHTKLLHGSKQQTYQTFVKYFTHPLCKTFISKYVKACLTCRCTNIPKLHDQNLVSERTFEAQAAREILSFDLITSLPISEGKNSILIIIDDFSGYIILCALTSIDSTKIEEALNHVFITIGFPRIARSDCDRRIIGALHKLQQKIPFIIASSAPYTHQQNGLAELSVYCP